MHIHPTPVPLPHHHCHQAHAKTVVVGVEDDRRWELKRDDIQLGDRLGGGNYGEVYQAKYHKMVLIPTRAGCWVLGAKCLGCLSRGCVHVLMRSGEEEQSFVTCC